MKKEFDGKVALVTGGGRGIGRAIARKLAENGAKVAINYLSNEEAAKVTASEVKKFTNSYMLIKANVADQKSVKRMVGLVEKDLGPVDLLVTNAGIAMMPEYPLDMNFETWKELMRVNLDGTYLPIGELIHGMIERGYGRIVCISSIAGLGMRPNFISYGTSKAAVIALVRNIAAAAAPTVRINSVAPGLIDTEMIEALDESTRKKMIENTPMKRIGRPEEMAETVLYLLSDRSSFTTGQTLVADGGRQPLP